jgi:hypothetical protein
MDPPPQWTLPQPWVLPTTSNTGNTQVLGDYDPDFFDSQELLQGGGRESSHEELSEESLQEDDFALHEHQTLEDLWWPIECLQDANNYNQKHKSKNKKC